MLKISFSFTFTLATFKVDFCLFTANHSIAVKPSNPPILFPSSAHMTFTQVKCQNPFAMVCMAYQFSDFNHLSTYTVMPLALDLLTA
jgi:hypothetical protein